jgi:fido (protein-threonine AMPylation protein)
MSRSRSTRSTSTTANSSPDARLPAHIPLSRSTRCQTGEPFLHHRWIDTYTSAITQQLRLEDNLATRTDPGQWADRAAYYWAAMLHAHPYREGNGRSIRVWIEDLAQHAGHELDWTRASAERNVHVAVAAANGDYEPMRALLTVAAGGTVGVDREVAALDDLD